MWTRFIELAEEISTQIPRYVVSRLVEALNGEGSPSPPRSAWLPLPASRGEAMWPLPRPCSIASRGEAMWPLPRPGGYTSLASQRFADTTHWVRPPMVVRRAWPGSLTSWIAQGTPSDS